MRWLCCAAMLLAGAAAVRAEAPVDYLTQIKPVLEHRCYGCHGAVKQKGKLRIDTVSSMMGRAKGAVVTPGDPGNSVLFNAITSTDPDERMPQEGQPLSDEQIAAVKLWIEQGAHAPADEKPMKDPREHWAFVPPVKRPLPAVKDAAWVSNPIDNFVAAQYAMHGLKPQPDAPRHVLIRRVYLDLIGLPPTPEEVAAFERDTSDGALGKVVDELLASPRYGERWGRHWMDVWRYSDWSGYKGELRDSAKHIWHWRDWIIGSLNDDKGYDRMVREMLAGDEIAPTDPDALAATGFLVRNYFKFNRNTWLEGTVEHTAKALLGMTMNCARCHDHMYDPVSQEEYYQFRAFFETHQIRTDRLPGVADVEKDGLPRVFDTKAVPTYLFERGDEKKPRQGKTYDPALPAIFGGAVPITPVKLPPEAYYPALKPSEQKLLMADVEAKVAKWSAEYARRCAEPADKADAAEIAYADMQRRASEGERALLAGRLAAERARYLKQGDDVKAAIETAAKLRREYGLLIAEAALAEAEREQKAAKGAVAIKKAAVKAKEAKSEIAAAEAERQRPLGSGFGLIGERYQPESTGRRSALANWIMDRKNPLAARVAVNHIWMRHFGQPLVPTVFEFGVNGKPPTHPALLDWLAVEFMDHGWSMKYLHKLIVTSHTYRIGSDMDDAVARKTDPDNQFLWHYPAHRMEAEVVRDSVLALAGNLDMKMGGPDIDQASALTVPRRSLYFRHAHEKYAPFLQTFDGASVEECYRRSETVVPQQALALANSSLTLGQSRLLAAKIAAHADGDGPFIDAAFHYVLSRPPTGDEAQAATAFLAEQSARLKKPEELTPFEADQKVAVKPSADPHARAREDLVHVLLNHTEFVTIR